MSGTRLTTGDLMEITGVPPDGLDRLVADGLLNPTVTAFGANPRRGGDRLFSLADCLAVAYLRAAQETGAPVVRKVVKYLANLDESELTRALDDGRRFVLLLPGRVF